MDKPSLFSRIDSAVAAHAKGLASLLYSRMNSWIRRTSSATLVKLPRLMPSWLISPNQRSA